jgi:biopolymer transport protein ExbD
MQRDDGPVADINITPFVDVVLVLLVIFMVTAPALMQNGLKIELPKSQSTDALAPESLGVAVTESGQLLLSGRVLSEEDFLSAARDAVERNSEIQAVISADKNSKHQSLVVAMDLLKRAGLDRFAIEIRPDENNP